jgi:hypothetical protein
MISASRTHRHFNVDKYLDEQLATSPDNGKDYYPVSRSMTISEGDRVMHVSASAEQLRQISDPRKRRFRDWAVRFNDRIECWMERVNWKSIDAFVSKVFGVALTGVALYLIFVVLNAFFNHLLGGFDGAIR